MLQQLPLPVSLNDDARFENFYAGDNQQVIHTLKQQLNNPEGSFVFLWGAPSSGLSHLLQASCHHAAELDVQSIYLPLDELGSYGPEVLEGIDALPLVVLDSLDKALPNSAWEEALFHLFNNIRNQQGHLLIGASKAPNQLNIQLKDLLSRLNWGLTFQVHGLSDEASIQALILRAQNRGLNLSEDVARYMLQRSPRDAHAVFALLDKLDHASLVEKRKITIPFVKSLL